MVLTMVPGLAKFLSDVYSCSSLQRLRRQPSFLTLPPSCSYAVLIKSPHGMNDGCLHQRRRVGLDVDGFLGNLEIVSPLVSRPGFREEAILVDAEGVIGIRSPRYIWHTSISSLASSSRLREFESPGSVQVSPATWSCRREFRISSILVSQLDIFILGDGVVYRIFPQSWTRGLRGVSQVGSSHGTKIRADRSSNSLGAPASHKIHTERASNGSYEPSSDKKSTASAHHMVLRKSLGRQKLITVFPQSKEAYHEVRGLGT